MLGRSHWSRRPVRLVALAVGLALFSLSPATQAQEQGQKLIVGVKSSPPFLIKQQDGSWKGLAMELWRWLAADLGVEYELRELDIPGIMDGLAAGELDLSIAPLTITAEREERVDFSQPFFVGGLGIAVRRSQGGSLSRVMGRLVSGDFLKVLGLLFLVLLVAGLLVWLFERRRNIDQFGGGVARGLGSGFWWSAVTMTTVGYGDKAPQTLGGRIVALVWMFISVIIISSFTAAISSSLTVSQLEPTVHGPDDLPAVRVGSVENTQPAAYLSGRGVDHRSFGTLNAAVMALAAGSLDAVVYDAPILRYVVRAEQPERVGVLAIEFERQNYGFALRPGSPLREQLDRALLRIIAGTRWATLVRDTLGSD